MLVSSTATLRYRMVVMIEFLVVSQVIELPAPLWSGLTSRADLGNCRAHYFDHRCRRSHHRRVVDLCCAHAGSHALRHEALGLGQDHVVLFGHEEPTRQVTPTRASHATGDTGG